MDERIGLRQAVAALRIELSESIRAAAGESIKFEVGEITLEFQVEVERAAGGKGEIQIWVAKIGADASRKQTSTHTVTVPLKPVTSHGGPVLTGSARQPD